MVKYADIAKDRLKPFADDFETKVKLATKVKGANDKTATTLKWGNGISAKVEHKTAVALPLVDEVALKQTVEFTQNDYTLTSEFTKFGSVFTGKWQKVTDGVTGEYTVRSAPAGVTVEANTKFDAAGNQSWKVNAAHELQVDDATKVQVGGQVNNKIQSEFSLGLLAGFGSILFKSNLASHSTASLFPVPAVFTGLFGSVFDAYKVSVGHSADHTKTFQVKDPALVAVAAGKSHTIKAKFTNIASDAPSTSVSLIAKAPLAFTGTWSFEPKGNVFGINLTL